MSAKRAIIPVFVPHLGCPHNCVFCNQRRITGQEKAAGAADVHKALKKAAEIETDRERELAFYGGSFTAIPEKEQEALLEAAFQAKESGFLSAIRLSTRPDCVDEAALARLKKYGVTTVELGAQSMDEEVLRLSGRGHSAEDTARAAKLVKHAGFSLILQMMTGLPGDTPEKSRETARKLAALGADGVRIYPTVILRDTPLFDLWKRGKYREHSVEAAVELCADLLEIFEEKEIPVIRLGLNPTEELSAGVAAGGAYHPAFGELCYSRRLRRQAESLLTGRAGQDLCLLVPKGKGSAMIGQKRENIRFLEEKFALRRLRVREADCSSPRLEV